jgi:transposase
VTPPPDSSCLSSAEKDALIASLLARIDELSKRLTVLEAQNAALRAENASLRAKLDLPPKTPDNSSTPPSQGHKASRASTTKPKEPAPAKAGGKPHAGLLRTPWHSDLRRC